jgi:hypothetical protein
MGYNFRNLDGRTRALMMEEINGDIACNALAIPNRLTPQGQLKFPALLRAAAASGNEETLAASLRAGDALKHNEMRRGKLGVAKTNLPANAADILAEEAFNRFYVRAQCRIAIEANSSFVTVYRATATDAASEVELSIGKQMDPVRLLADLRNCIDLDSALGLSAGRHYGLSVGAG